MQTCPGFLLKSLLESPGNLLEISSVKFVDTLYTSGSKSAIYDCRVNGLIRAPPRYFSKWK